MGAGAFAWPAFPGFLAFLVGAICACLSSHAILKGISSFLNATGLRKNERKCIEVLEEVRISKLSSELKQEKLRIAAQ